MIKSTAAQLARLKVTYPLWLIIRNGEGFKARERAGRRHLTGTSPADLENKLIRATNGRWEHR